MLDLTEKAWTCACQLRSAGVKLAVNHRFGLYNVPLLFHDKLLAYFVKDANCGTRFDAMVKTLEAAGFSVHLVEARLIDVEDIARRFDYPDKTPSEVGVAMGRIGAWARKAKGAMGKKRRQRRRIAAEARAENA